MAGEPEHEWLVQAHERRETRGLARTRACKRIVRTAWLDLWQ